MIAWEGYTQPQWVNPFEKQTGCIVHAKYAGSSDEMVALMRSGGGNQYDMVSASGDASLRLIYGGDVQVVDPSKIPDFKNFGKAFQSPPNNTVDGKHYGISLQWGPNTLLYNTQKVVKPAPTSWSAIYSPKYKGEITVPDNPIQIADVALYLMKTQPSLGITRPLRAHPAAVQRGDRAARQAEAADQEVLGARLRRDRPLQERRRGHRRLLALPDQHAAGSRRAGRRTSSRRRARPAGSTPGWSPPTRKNLACAYKWLAYISTPKVQAEQAIYFGETPVNTLACSWMDKLSEGLVREVPRERAARLLQADLLLEDADRELRQRPERLRALPRSGSRPGRR